MPEHPPVRLRKTSGGGCTISWEGESYTWPADDPVTEVPYDLALDLLAIPDGGYRVDGDPEPLAPVLATPGLAQTAGTAGLGGSEEGAPQEPSPAAGEDEDGGDAGERGAGAGGQDAASAGAEPARPARSRSSGPAGRRPRSGSGKNG